MSLAQRGIWFAQQLDQDSPSYTIAEYLEIAGWIDVALLDAAVRRVVAETDTLNVRFTQDGQELRQVCEPADKGLSVVDISTEPDPRAAAEAWMRAETGRPVSLESGRTFTLALLRAGTDRYFFYLRGHHLVTDGYMCALFVHRLAEVYTAALHGAPVRQDDGDGSLDLLLDDEAAYRASERYARDRDYWLGRLAGRPEPPSLADRVVGVPRSVLREIAQLPSAAVDALRASARPVTGRPPRCPDGCRGGLPQPDDRRRGGGPRHPGDREDRQRTRHPWADVQRTAAPAGRPARHERRGAPAPGVHRGPAVLLQGEAESFLDQDVPEAAAEAFAAKFGWDPRAEEGSFLYVPWCRRVCALGAAYRNYAAESSCATGRGWNSGSPRLTPLSPLARSRSTAGVLSSGLGSDQDLRTDQATGTGSTLTKGTGPTRHARQ